MIWILFDDTPSPLSSYVNWKPLFFSFFFCLFACFLISLLLLLSKRRPFYATLYYTTHTLFHFISFCSISPFFFFYNDHSDWDYALYSSFSFVHSQQQKHGYLLVFFSSFFFSLSLCPSVSAQPLFLSQTVALVFSIPSRLVSSRYPLLDFCLVYFTKPPPPRVAYIYIYIPLTLNRSVFLIF